MVSFAKHGTSWWLLQIITILHWLCDSFAGSSNWYFTYLSKTGIWRQMPQSWTLYPLPSHPHSHSLNSFDEVQWESPAEVLKGRISVCMQKIPGSVATISWNTFSWDSKVTANSYSKYWSWLTNGQTHVHPYCLFTWLRKTCLITTLKCIHSCKSICLTIHEKIMWRLQNILLFLKNNLEPFIQR